MKKLIAFMGVLLIMLTLAATPAVAGPEQPGAGSFVNAGDVPPGSTLIINITYKVTNDEDSGFFAYWALDNYNKTIQVWQTPDGSFYAIARYTGSFTTFAGAKSPQAGIAESKGGSGSMFGGWVGTFTGTLNPAPTLPTRGNIGTFDFGGTKADVLSASQAGSTTPFDWMSVYFSGVTGFEYGNWGWTYKYRSQTWNNFDSGSNGDIVIQ